MKLVIVVFDGVQALDIAGPMDVFAEANNYLPAHQHYQVTLVGLRAGSVRCANGLALDVGIDYLQYDDQPDLLLVAGGPKLPDVQAYAPRFLEWLGAKAAGSQRFGSVCNGAFTLGHAGLLNGKEVTAHWHDVDRLVAQFPQGARAARQDLRARRQAVHLAPASPPAWTCALRWWPKTGATRWRCASRSG
jgi:transcriptional regulator GlxA family with amidase domain